MDIDKIQKALDDSFAQWTNYFSNGLEKEGIHLDEMILLKELESLLTTSLEGVDCEWERGSLHDAINSYWNYTLKDNVESIKMNGWKAKLKGAEKAKSYKGLRCDLLPVRYIAGVYYSGMAWNRDQRAAEMKRINDDNEFYQQFKQDLKEDDERFGRMMIRKYEELNSNEEELKKVLIKKWSWGLESRLKGNKDNSFNYVKNL